MLHFGSMEKAHALTSFSIKNSDDDSGAIRCDPGEGLLLLLLVFPVLLLLPFFAGPCAPRRGRLPHSGGHPIGPGPKGSTGIRPVPGVEATMKRAVTWTADWKGTARFESSPPMKYSRGSKCNEWVFRIKISLE